MEDFMEIPLVYAGVEAVGDKLLHKYFTLDGSSGKYVIISGEDKFFSKPLHPGNPGVIIKVKFYPASRKCSTGVFVGMWTSVEDRSKWQISSMSAKAEVAREKLEAKLSKTDSISEFTAELQSIAKSMNYSDRLTLALYITGLIFRVPYR